MNGNPEKELKPPLLTDINSFEFYVKNILSPLTEKILSQSTHENHEESFVEYPTISSIDIFVRASINEYISCVGLPLHPDLKAIQDERFFKLHKK